MAALSIPEIQEVNKSHWQSIQERFDNLIKPVGSLARLEDITCLYAAAQGLADVDYPQKTLLLFVGEQKMEKICQEPGEQAAADFAAELAAGSSSLDILAASFGAAVKTVFLAEAMGKTRAICKENAMSAEQFAAAFELGKTFANEAIEAGARVLGLGCFAPAASLGHTAMVMALFKKSYREISADNDLAKAQLLDGMTKPFTAVPQADIVHLAKSLGGYELPAMAGAILQAASMNVPVFLDGLATVLAASLAEKLAPQVREYFVAVSTTTEAGQNILLTEQQLSTMLDLKLSLPTGEAGLFGFNLLDAGIKALREMDSFGRVHSPLGDL